MISINNVIPCLSTIKKAHIDNIKTFNYPLDILLLVLFLS